MPDQCRRPDANPQLTSLARDVVAWGPVGNANCLLLKAAVIRSEIDDKLDFALDVAHSEDRSIAPGLLGGCAERTEGAVVDEFYIDTQGKSAIT